METLLLIIFLVLTVPVVLISSFLFMIAGESGVSAAGNAIVLLLLSTAGVYVYGMYKFYYVLKPVAAAVPNGYLWLIIPAWLFWAFIQGRK